MRECHAIEVTLHFFAASRRCFRGVFHYLAISHCHLADVVYHLFIWQNQVVTCHTVIFIRKQHLLQHFTFKAILIIIYFLLCFTSACYPLAMADTILASVGVNFWQFIVIWQELYTYTTWISYLLLYYKAGWKRWLYLLYMLGVPTLL